MSTFFNLNPLTSYIKQNNLTELQFCKMCKITIGTLHKIYQQDPTIPLNHVLRISRFINRPITDFVIE